MSEQLPNNDAFRDHLPLPNEEEAWQKMQLLLDKEEKRRRVIPFWFWRYALITLLLAGITTGGYFLLKTEKRQQATTSLTEKNTQGLEKIPQANKKPLEKEKATAEIATIDESEKPKAKPVQPSVTDIVKTTKEHATSVENVAIQKGITTTLKTSPAQKSLTRKKTAGVKEKPDAKKTVALPEPISRNDGNPFGTAGSIKPSPIVFMTLAEPRTVSITDTELKKKSDSVRALDSARIVAPPVVSNEKQKQQKKSRYVLSAGVGLQQAIAFGGQQASSYNLNGKQNRFSDHIPSGYLRLQRGKWFLQGEWHYRVPQPVKPFSFSQTTSYNAANKTLETERYAVQKLYYHQLPISINYFVLPAWSLGIGATYNRFAGVVTGQEVTSRSVTNGAETTLRQVVPVKRFTDSFLYRSTAGVVLQTDYHVKRLSFGLRYTSNLQPFITYTAPDGAVLSEKNQVLQAILRFRLF